LGQYEPISGKIEAIQSSRDRAHRWLVAERWGRRGNRARTRRRASVGHETRSRGACWPGRGACFLGARGTCFLGARRARRATSWSGGWTGRGRAEGVDRPRESDLVLRDPDRSGGQRERPRDSGIGNGRSISIQKKNSGGQIGNRRPGRGGGCDKERKGAKPTALIPC
jgi:hypothetical protein